MLWVLICTVHLTVFYYHYSNKFQTIVSLSNKGLLARRRRHICRLSNNSETQSHNHIVLPWTIHCLAKLVRWSSLVVRTSLHGKFGYVLFHSIDWTNQKGLLARRRRHIWSLSDSNEIRNNSHLVPKFSWTSLMMEHFCEYLSVQGILMYVIIMSCTSFRVNPNSLVFGNVIQLLARSRRYISKLRDSNEIGTDNILVHKRRFNHLVKLAKWFSSLVSTSVQGAFDCMSRTFFIENLHSKVCLNVKEILAWRRRHNWSLSESKENWIRNYLTGKKTLNQLTKLVKWFGSVLSFYLYGAFDSSTNNQ